MTRYLPTLGLVLCTALAPLSGALAQAPAPSLQAQALPHVDGAWVRATVAGQQGSGAFMRITSPVNAKLVSAATPVAGTAEVHEMKMEGDVMQMRAVPQLALPAGRTVELTPGGYHIMLMDLKQALKPGTTVPLTLVFQDAAGGRHTVNVQAPVAVMAPGGQHGGMDMHKH